MKFLTWRVGLLGLALAALAGVGYRNLTMVTTVAQQTFYTETEIYNAVYDSATQSLRTSGGGGSSLTIQEIDGAPTGIPTTLKVSNGALTNNGDGSFTLVTGAGGGGDFSSNTATSVDSEILLFSGTAGKTGKRATGSGLVSATSGVYGNVTTSAGLAGIITDETGSGALVFGTSPSFTTPALGTPSAINLANATGFPVASTTVAGISEMATAAETTTGTDATRGVTPDSLAHSDYGKRYLTFECIAHAAAVTTGDGKCYLPLDDDLAGWVVVAARAWLGAAVSSSGAVTVDMDICGAAATGAICSGTNRDLFSTNGVIDQNENRTQTGTAPVINTAASANVIAAGEVLRGNVDGAGTGTQGLYFTVVVQRP